VGNKQTKAEYCERKQPEKLVQGPGMLPSQSNKLFLYFVQFVSHLLKLLIVRQAFSARQSCEEKSASDRKLIVASKLSSVAWLYRWNANGSWLESGILDAYNADGVTRKRVLL